MIPVVILAGGRSSRMGQPKALVSFGSGRLIDHVAQRISRQGAPVIVNANDPAITVSGSAASADIFPGHLGPLAGIHAGLSYIKAHHPHASHSLFLPVDGPFFPDNLVQKLSAALQTPDDIALCSSHERLHPVIGLWPVSLLPALSIWLENPPTLKVRAFLQDRPVRVVAFEAIQTYLGPLDPFFNINDRNDLDHALKMLGALQT